MKQNQGFEFLVFVVTIFPCLSLPNEQEKVSVNLERNVE